MPRGLSNAIAIVVVIMVLLAGFMSFAYMGRVGTEYAGKVLPEKLREEGERGSELLRIYIWSRNHTLEGEPVITILNAWGKDSEIDVIMVANRTGHVVKVIALGPPMRIPASKAVELKPSDLGLAYATFGELIENVGGILAHTVLGNSFGSTWGFPREEYVFGTIATTAITNVTTTVWEVNATSVQEETTISEYTTLTYPEEWGGEALIIAYDHLGPVECENRRPCNGQLCWKKLILLVREKPKVPDYWSSLCGPGVERSPRFSWYLAENLVRIIRHYGEYYLDWGGCGHPGWPCQKTLWECIESWTLKNVTLSAIEPGMVAVGLYVPARLPYTVVGSQKVTFNQTTQVARFYTVLTPYGYTTTITGTPTSTQLPPKWATTTRAINRGITETVTVGPTVLDATATRTISQTTTVALTYIGTGTPPQYATIRPTHTFSTYTYYVTTITQTGWKGTYTVTVVWQFTSRGGYGGNVIRTYTTTTAYVFATNVWLVGTVRPLTIYTMTGATATQDVTFRLVNPTPWHVITEPRLPPGYNPDYVEYEGGSGPGIYGPVTHLYFKVVYPIYIIHRYYEKECSCKSYSPPPPSGGPPSWAPSGNASQITVCDIRVIRDEEGKINLEYTNCKHKYLG